MKYSEVKVGETYLCHEADRAARPVKVTSKRKAGPYCLHCLDVATGHAFEANPSELDPMVKAKKPKPKLRAPEWVANLVERWTTTASMLHTTASSGANAKLVLDAGRQAVELCAEELEEAALAQQAGLTIPAGWRIYFTGNRVVLEDAGGCSHAFYRFDASCEKRLSIEDIYKMLLRHAFPRRKQYRS